MKLIKLHLLTLWYMVTSLGKLKVVPAREYHTKNLRGYYIVNRKQYNQRQGTPTHPLAGAQFIKL